MEVKERGGGPHLPQCEKKRRKSVLGGGGGEQTKKKRKRKKRGGGKEKGAAIKGRQSQPRLVNSPFLYTMKGDVTHRRPLPSHTNSPS